MTPFPDKWCEVTFGSRSANAPQLSLLTSTFFSKSSDFVLTAKVQLDSSTRGKGSNATPNLTLYYYISRIFLSPLDRAGSREEARKKNFSQLFQSYKLNTVTRLLTTSIGKPFSWYINHPSISRIANKHTIKRISS